jgi:hypothetical protein
MSMLTYTTERALSWRARFTQSSVDANTALESHQQEYNHLQANPS